jgi:hypothetical protein
MAQVDSENSIFASIDRKRRNFIAQAAAAVAGGALIAALPLLEAAGAAPLLPDPILAVIDAHKTARAHADHRSANNDGGNCRFAAIRGRQ